MLCICVIGFFKVLIDRALEEHEGLVHSSSVDLRTCGVEVSAAAKLFKDELNVYCARGAGGNMNGVAYLYKSEGGIDTADGDKTLGSLGGGDPTAEARRFGLRLL